MVLRTKLAIGAALLCLTTLLAAGVTALAMERISARLDAALAAEQRVARYSRLSTQISSFIIVAAETIQSGLPAPARADRLDGISRGIDAAFDRVRADLDRAVADARALGLDEATRRASQSLGIARMEALFAGARAALTVDAGDPDRLRAALDLFASSVDPLLNEIVGEEIRARNLILAGIAELRVRALAAALILSGLAAASAALFYFGLVRPQFRRLDMLLAAARRLGREDFALTLPDSSRDEIGRLMAETNRAARALSARQDRVAADRARLSEIVAESTAALRTANERLARIDADRRRFFADISHELRTPLTVILMEAEMGRAGGGPSAAAFATIETRARRLNHRIDDLLRVARSETGQLALEPGRMDLGEAARAAIAETRAEIDQAGLTATLDLADPLPCRGDPNWVRQVIANLLRNAIRHADGGGALALRGRAAPDGARLSVIDAGPGIADPDAALGRFVRGPGARGAGFGIGLPFARWVMEAQDGALRIVSPVPAEEALSSAPGTKVEIFLPATRD